jgi:acyl carrier protein
MSRSREETRATVLRLLSNVAPEADPATLRPDVSFRDQLDIDSMDLLNFVISLHKEFGVAIPERDYPKLMSIDGAVAYLENATGARGTGGNP